MRRDHKAFDKWNKSLRIKRLLLLMKADGVTVDSVDTLLDLIVKDKLVSGEEINPQQQRVLVEFLKVKNALDDGVNPLEISDDSIKRLREFIEK